MMEYHGPLLIYTTPSRMVLVASSAYRVARPGRGHPRPQEPGTVHSFSKNPTSTSTATQRGTCSILWGSLLSSTPQKPIVLDIKYINSLPASIFPLHQRDHTNNLIVFHHRPLLSSPSRKMKSFAILALTAIAGVFAAPAGDLEARQLGGSTANDFLRYGCKGVIMIYARASTEPGNIVCLSVLCFILPRL